METYQILRQIDYLRTSIDNLFREALWFARATTASCGDKTVTVKDETLSGLFMEQRARLDAVAEILHEYSVRTKVM